MRSVRHALVLYAESFVRAESGMYSLQMRVRTGEAPDLCGGRGLFCLVSTAGTAGRDFPVQLEARTQTSIPLAAYCTSAGHCDSALSKEGRELPIYNIGH